MKGMAVKSGKNNIDWNRIRLDYIKGGTSQHELAEKYGVSERGLAERCRKEGWVEERRRRSDRVQRKAREKTEEAQANKLASVMRSTALLSEKIEEVLGDPEQFDARVADARGISEMAKAIRMLDQTIRDLYDLPTWAERERLKRGGDDQSGSASGVVIMPEVDDG